jgi:hypothetical protein
MTTPSTPRKAGPLLGTGAQTSWPFTFKVFAASDIAVTIADNLGVETALVLGSDYSVTLNANQETSPGGTVTYPISGAALPVGKRLVIFGNLPYDQPLDLPSGGNFSPLAIENQLDRIVMQIQQLLDGLGRSLQVSITTKADVTLPPPEANQLIGWDSTGENLENVPLSELATAIAYGTYRYDTFTGDGTTTNFALSEDPAVLANLDVSISGVVQVPGTDYSLVSGNLVFTSAPSNGTAILARYGQALTALPDSDQITFVQAGAGAVTRTVQNKLREVVSLLDFGGDPTGVADSTDAFTKLTAYCAEKAMLDVLIPPGIYKVSDTISFQRMWFFTVRADGAAIRPDPTADWFHKNVVEFGSCYSGEIHGLKIPAYLDITAWQAVPLADRPVCGLMLYREPGTYTLQGLNITAGPTCQQIKIYNAYVFGPFLKAAYINTRAEGIFVEGSVFGGQYCSSVWDTGLPSSVYKSDDVPNSNRDKVFNMCEFQQEYYILGASFYPVVGLFDTCLDVRFEYCYLALGGMQASGTVVAGFELGTSVGTVGAIGFTNIVIQDCYAENAGNNFVTMWIRDYDIHDIKIDGWRHSQTDGTTNAIVRYSGSQQGADAQLHLERIRPPSNTTNLLLIDHDINWVTVKDCRGLINASSPGTRFITNAEIKMWADDAYNSAPTNDYTVGALLPNSYTLSMLKYPTVATYQRNRPVDIGATTFQSVTSTNCIAYFNRASSDVWDVTLTGTLTTVEGFVSVRPYEDLLIDFPMIGEFEKFTLKFSTNTTLKHNYAVNAAFEFILKTNADTTYASGRVAQFIRNGNLLIEL